MIQKLLLSYVLKPLGKQMDRFREKTKENIFVLFGAFLFFYQFLK